MKLKVRKEKLRGGAVYVLPNMITTGNLFFGFFSIVKGLQGHLLWSASAILLAAIFDVLDGRVARLTGGTSEFGVQYDSLCDLVSFGLAPAFLMYNSGLSGFGRLGWIVCFVFLAGGALRLARYNVQSSIGKASGDFTGLPIPMAAGVLACFVAATVSIENSEYNGTFLRLIGAWTSDPVHRGYLFVIAGPALGLAMVSNINYRSHKMLKIRGVNPFKLLVVAVALTGLVAIEPEIFGFLFFLCYALSGPVEWILGGKRAIEDDDIFAPDDDTHEDDLSSEEKGGG